MFQAFVYSLSRGRVQSVRDFPDAETAAQSQAALIRSFGCTMDRDQLAAELATGRKVTWGRFEYWVKEAP
jgi:hypothetical protein